MLLRREQKSGLWMTYFLFKFRRTGELVLDSWCGTLAAATACLQGPEYCRFLQCEKNTACFLDEFLMLAEVHAKQVMNADSDIAESKEAVVA